MYSIIAGIVGTIFLLVAGLLHLLWVGKSLKDTTDWRIKLERALKEGTHGIYDEWVQRKLPLPVSFDAIKVQLAQARKRENKLQRRRKLVIASFYVLGTLFLLFGYLLAIGVY